MRSIDFSLMKKYVRVNTLRISVKEFLEKTEINLSPTIIPFMFEVRDSITIGKTWEYISGLIHPQSLSSAIPPLVLEPKKGERILDATASPGSKTTEIAMLVEDYGVIVANDRWERLRAIRGNLKRLGVTSVILTSFDTKRLPFKEVFDKVLLDPPCTALGAHKSAWSRFNQDIAKSLSRVQKAMILSCFDALKPGGVLVYSTCTITEEENEGVVSYLLSKRDNAYLEDIDIDLPHEKGNNEYGSEMEKTWRIYPEHLKSEAFFIAKIIKK